MNLSKIRMNTKRLDTLVVGISATALFDLGVADRLFKSARQSNPETAVEIYRQHMMENEEILLQPGTGYPLVRALLGLNNYHLADEQPLVEVVVMSRNSSDTAIRVLNSIRHEGFKIERLAFTAGDAVVPYIDAFGVDLFLTTNPDDAQKVIDSRACAAAIVTAPPESAPKWHSDQVRIAFDGDAVLFDESSELVFKTQGISIFHQEEDSKQDIPLEEGPYANLLRKLSHLQQRLKGRGERQLVRIALVTSRGSPAEMRVIKTLRHWGICVDESFFLGGARKERVLTVFNPHIFFDDQMVHLEPASKVVPAGRVPYPINSPLNDD